MPLLSGKPHERGAAETQEPVRDGQRQGEGWQQKGQAEAAERWEAAESWEAEERWRQGERWHQAKGCQKRMTICTLDHVSWKNTSLATKKTTWALTANPNSQVKILTINQHLRYLRAEEASSKQPVTCPLCKLACVTLTKLSHANAWGRVEQKRFRIE